SQVELANLGRRDVDIVRAREIVVLRGTQEAESVRQAFKDAFRENQSALFRLCAEDLEDQLLFAHTAGAGNIQFLGDLSQIGDIFFLKFSKADAYLVVSFCSRFF